MKIVFNPVPAEFTEMDDSEHFTDPQGREYYYKLEVSDEGNGEGTFKIYDTCDRYLPFDFESLDDLVLVLTNLQKTIKLGELAKARYEADLINLWKNNG